MGVRAEANQQNLKMAIQLIANETGCYGAVWWGIEQSAPEMQWFNSYDEALDYLEQSVPTIERLDKHAMHSARYLVLPNTSRWP